MTLKLLTLAPVAVLAALAGLLNYVGNRTALKGTWFTSGVWAVAALGAFLIAFIVYVAYKEGRDSKAKGVK